MSKAFTREDVDPPERSGRRRSASGLPPGALNYITARGAFRLREELATLRASRPPNENSIDELERILSSATIVNPPSESTNSIAFGATVTVSDAAGTLKSYRIVGVDELDLEAGDAVSWVSPTGKVLLSAELGDRVTLERVGSVRIVKVEYSD